MLPRLLTGLLLLGLPACVEPEERPDFIDTCDAPDCRPRSGHRGGATSSGGSSSTGGGSDAVTVSGNLWLLNDTSFSFNRAQIFTEPATVVSFDRNQRLIEAEYDGQQFSLSGLLASERTLVLSLPDNSSGPALPTVVQLDTQESHEAMLPLVNGDVLREIFIGLTTQSVLDPERAQVVYQALDADLEPLAGVRLEVTGAEFVAYALGTSFSDALTETGEEGLAIVGNLPASPLPGSNVSVTVSGAVAGQQVISLVQGAVTYALLIAD